MPDNAKYNTVLRALAKREEVTGSKYSTTIQVIVSDIPELASVAKAHDVVYRGLRVNKVALGSAFYVLDFQGFTGGVESSEAFMMQAQTSRWRVSTAARARVAWEPYSR